MNYGLRCGQMMVGRHSEVMSNIVERTALWYRLERIGQEPIEPPAKSEVVPPNRQVLQLKAHLVYLQNKVNEHLDKMSKRRTPYTTPDVMSIQDNTNSIQLNTKNTK